MNWYKHIKISAPIPEAEDYPKPFGDKEYSDYKDHPELSDYIRYNTGTIEMVDYTLKNTSIFDKYGPLKYVGSGTQGVAYYSTPKNQIVKITFDQSEYNAAKKNMSKSILFDEKIPHIVQVYDAEEVPIEDIKEGTSRQLYLIVMEKLLELEALEKIVIHYITEHIFYETEYKNSDVLNELQFKIFKKMIEKTSINRSFFNDVFYKFFDMTNFLTGELNMKLSDLHEDNIGKRDDGTYILMDLGHSYFMA